ncbi:MAG: MFS transporter [Planctomycetota bacterium]
MLPDNAVNPNEPATAAPPAGWFARSFLIQRGEGWLVVWACLFYFFLMAAYFIVQPIRDEMAQAYGVENKNTLVQLGLLTMVCVHIGFSGLVSRLPRQRFVPVLYRFFGVNLLIFLLLFRSIDPAEQGWLAQAFFIWVGVFSLFIMSLFWGVMADLLRHHQAARLFGIIGAAGTLGGIVGPQLTSNLVSKIGIAYMLAISILFLEAAIFAVSRLWKLTPENGTAQAPAAERQSLLAGALEGMKLVARSPYLLGICAFIFIYSLTGMLLWTAKQDIVHLAFASSNDRIEFFAGVVTWNNSATLLLQLFLTSRILKNMGSGIALAAVPVVTGIGFAFLGGWPTLWMIVVFEVSRKVCQYVAAKPAQNMLYTVVSRSARYKSKTFIDTFVYRGGDSVSSATTSWVLAGGSSISVVLFGSIPVALLWMGIALLLGRQQRKLANDHVE